MLSCLMNSTPSPVGTGIRLGTSGFLGIKHSISACRSLHSGVLHPCTMSLSGSSNPPDDHVSGDGYPLTPATTAGVDAPDVALNPQSIYGSRKASLVLDIIVVGCGIGGLGAAFCLSQAGHRVTIVESSPVIRGIGAGIQNGPNASRLLRRWGLREHLDQVAVQPEGLSLRRYKTGELLGFTRWGEATEKEYGAPFYQTHRADLHKLLYDLVAPHVTIFPDSSVVECNPDPASSSVTLESGKVMKADLIVGADGVKSYIQQVVSGKSNPAEPMGDAAYRAIIPASLMKQDPELREFIDKPQMTVWLAPGRHMVAYPVVRQSPLF